MKAFLLAIWEVAEVVIIAVITVFLIRTFLVQPFLVSGASMEPNFSTSDYLLIDEITYRFREPQRGEVVVFKYPNDPKTYYIKRIIGLPGETVEITGGNVFVYDTGGSRVKLEELYLRPSLETSGSLSKDLGEKEYFVMGDNRGFSFDSRSWGKLDEKYIIGLVRLRLLPLTSVRLFDYVDVVENLNLIN